VHGQKRYGKRSLEGSLTLDGLTMFWKLISEPQAREVRGPLVGMRISVRAEGGRNRELILEYPFPKKAIDPSGLPHFPQRPKLSAKTVEAGIRQAIAAGYDPASRGRALVFQVSELSH
jgi:hypothetical protein